MYLRLIPLIYKNLIRSKVRLFVTVLGCGIAAFMVCFFLAADYSVGRVFRQAESANQILISQLDKHCPGTSRLNDAELERIRQIPEVEELLPTKVVMTDCGATGDVIVVHGLDRERISKFRDYQMDNTTYNRWISTKNGVIAGTQIFKKYDWKIGEEVTLEQLGGISFTICGVFQTQSPNDENLLIADRDYLQLTQDDQGTSSLAWVRLKTGANTDAVMAAIEKIPMTNYISVKLEKAHLLAALSQFQDLMNASRYVMAVILAVILVAIGNTVSMTVRERYAEFSIMRTLGYTKFSIIYMVLCDSIFMTILGSVVGCFFLQCVVWANWIDGIKNCDVNIIFSSNYSVWISTISVVAFAGLLGALLPAINAARINILDGIRKGD